MDFLTRMEEWLLLTVWKLQHDNDQAYGLAIRNALSETLGRDVSVGATYVPLERLRKRGFLESRDSRPTDKRGGRSTRYYRLSSKGVTALNAVKTVHDRAWNSLPDINLGLKPG